MRKTLFRAEAIEHNRSTLAGEVLAAHALSLRMATFVCLVLVGVVVTFACIGEYTPKTRVRGYLEPIPQHATTASMRADGATASLQATLWVPSHSISLVNRGYRVALRYDAFPFQRFGSFPGTVVDIAEAPIAVGDATYRVTVELASQVVSVDNEVKPLRAGMELAADIQLKRERIIDWIIKPMFGTAQRN